MDTSRIMLLGFGGVGRSLFKLLLEEKLFPIDNIMIADKTRKAFRYFEKNGGRKENFYLFQMDSKCYKEILDHLEAGDYFIYLAVGSDHLTLAKECAAREIHFLCTTDDTFYDQPFNEPFRYRKHFYEYKELMLATEGHATSVLQFGSNPGLVSLLTKRALKEIVETDETSFVSEHRERLRKMLEGGAYALLARELAVTAFIETDLDTTASDYEEHEDTAYSTWSVADFDAEMNDRTIQTVGSGTSLTEHLERVGVPADKVYYYNKQDGTLVLDIEGKYVKTGGYVKDQYMEGCVDAHEEVLSIHDYYTVRDSEGEILYAPSTMFVYRPCEIALRSMHHKENNFGKLITKDRMVSGGETIGICVEGRNFHPIYVGIERNYDSDREDTPTVLLVSASVLAAIRYMHDHPDEGVLLPEYLDADEILEHVSPWIPVIINRI